MLLGGILSKLGKQLAEILQSPTKANAKPCMWGKTISCSMGWLVRRQLCRTGPGSPSEQQVVHESAVCPCGSENQQHPRLESESVLAGQEKWSLPFVCGHCGPLGLPRAGETLTD